MALNAAFFHDVTMFHPIRPLVKWSRVEKRLAKRKGGSNDVEAVMAKPRFLVTAAMADMGLPFLSAWYFHSMVPPGGLTIVGSVTGH